MKVDGRVLIIAGVILLLAVYLSGANPTLANAQQVQILNPGFEGGFREYGGIGELTVANGWQPWYVEGGGYHRPEYGAESRDVGRGRVRDGAFAQKQFVTFAKQDGGIYQRIDVEADQWYDFSCWVYVWSSDGDNPDVSTRPGKCAALVGINPWGDARAIYRTTIWGKESVGNDGLLAYDQWVHVSVRAQAWTDKVVAFTRGVAEFGVKHNDVYIDACEFRQISDPGGQPIPTVEPTPEPADFDYERIRGIIREELDNTRLTH